MQGGEAIPCRGSWTHLAEQWFCACSQAVGHLECLDCQCTDSECLLQASGGAKHLTQASYISAVTSWADRDTAERRAKISLTLSGAN